MWLDCDITTKQIVGKKEFIFTASSEHMNFIR